MSPKLQALSSECCFQTEMLGVRVSLVSSAGCLELLGGVSRARRQDTCCWWCWGLLQFSLPQSQLAPLPLHPLSVAERNNRFYSWRGAGSHSDRTSILMKERFDILHYCCHLLSDKVCKPMEKLRGGGIWHDASCIVLFASCRQTSKSLLSFCGHVLFVLWKLRSRCVSFRK